MLTFDPPVIIRTNAQTAADQERFITVNLDELAYFGYAHYQEQGQGLIALFPEEFSSPEGCLGREHLYYLPAEAIAFFIDGLTQGAATRPAFLQELQHIITSYNPCRAIVIGFLARAPLESGQRMNLYVVDCITPPPLAYAAHTN